MDGHGADKIAELDLLGDLELLSERYERRHSAPPVNLSAWDPSNYFKRRLSLKIPTLGRTVSAADYIFSYRLTEMPQILAALGYKEGNKKLLVTHSGSAALVSVVNWLSFFCKKRVLLIGPFYFTVPQLLRQLGVPYDIAYTRRTAEGFGMRHISKSVLARYDAVWVTNPVYCASVYFGLDDVRYVDELADQGLTVVVDECLAEPRKGFATRLRNHGNVVSIHAPHKSICVNAMKFACVAYPPKFEKHFDHWSDVWQGCVPASSALAVKHFLSKDYQRYRDHFWRLREKVRLSLVAGLPGERCLCDAAADGYLNAFYFPEINAQKGLEMRFLAQCLNKSGALFISGARNHMPPEVGLSFRVNLAAFTPQFDASFRRLVAWLARLR